MLLNKPIQDVIRSRTSVRTYDGRSLSEKDRQFIKNCLADAHGPFSASIRLQYVGHQDAAAGQQKKLGTYGVIRGTRDFVAAVIKPKEAYSLEQLGYVLEKVILQATSRGIGACWLGGTFRRGKFADAVGLGQDELLPVVIPVGYPRGSRSWIDRVFRLTAGSANRKEWESLFFRDNFHKSLNWETAGDYAEALEMVRLAPSASNKQPWRVVMDKQGFHFILQKTRGYGASLGFEVQRLDIGIAMCHFELTAREKSLTGKWRVLPGLDMELPEGSVYVNSWVY